MVNRLIGLIRVALASVVGVISSCRGTDQGFFSDQNQLKNKQTF
jgi:hypothetical protein